MQGFFPPHRLNKPVTLAEPGLGTADYKASQDVAVGLKQLSQPAAGVRVREVFDEQEGVWVSVAIGSTQPVALELGRAQKRKTCSTCSSFLEIASTFTADANGKVRVNHLHV
jgi:RNase P subunit RPR2